MEIFTKLLFLIFVSSTCSSGSPLGRIFDHSRTINLLTDDESECFCFQKSPSSVSVQNKLHIPGHDLERLVVFLYRDTVTKEVKVFTPRAEKQLLIPDLTMDTSDTILTVPNHSIDNVFKNSPWVARQKQINYSSQLNNNHVFNYASQKQVGSFDADDSIGTNFGTIKPMKSNNDINLISDHISADYNQDNNIYMQKKLHGSLIAHNEQSSNLGYEPNENISGNGKKYFSSSSGKVSDFTETHVDTENKDLIGLPNADEEQKFVPCSDNKSQKSCVTKYMHDLGTTTSPVTASLITAVKNKPNFYMTFDKWVNDQMKQVDTNTFEINTFKRRLEETLKENGMSVSSDKVVDGNGHIVDMAKLELRHIYIGGSVDYGSMLKERVNNKFRFPPDLPYLESILVTQADPSRLLGMIPLGKVYLPIESAEKHLNRKTSKIAGNTDVLTSRRRNKDALENVFLDNNLVDQALARYLNYFRRTSNENQLQEPTEDEKIQKLLDHGQEDISEGKSRWNRIFREKDPVRTVSEVLPEHRFESVLNTLAELEDVKETVEEKEDVGDEVLESNDEDLGFRIVGGNPATSSGSMLQSKGRSGFIEVD